MNIDQHDKLCQTYWDTYGRVLEDPEYARLLAMLEELKPRYEAVLETLPADVREIIARSVLLRESMASRMLEYVCSDKLRESSCEET